MISDASKRVTMFRESLGLKQREFAQELGVSQPSVARMEKSESDPSKGFLKKLYDRYGIRADWVLTGEPPMYRAGWIAQPPGFAEVAQIVKSIIPPDIDDRIRWARREDARRFPDYPDEVEWVKVRPFDLDASGTPPVLVPIYDTKALISLPKEWFDDRGIDPDNAGLLRSTDHDMAPTVPRNALALVDFADAGLAFNGIHALIQDGELLIRRLTRLGDAADPLASVAIAVDSHARPPDTLQGADLARITILGRVRAMISTLD